MHAYPFHELRLNNNNNNNNEYESLYTHLFYCVLSLRTKIARHDYEPQRTKGYLMTVLQLLFLIKLKTLNNLKTMVKKCESKYFAGVY